MSTKPATLDSLEQLRQDPQHSALGYELYDRVKRLYPICRSITGDGVRQTLSLIGEELELSTTEVPSGTRVFDWVIPPEWNLRGAYLKNSSGRKIIDVANSNLHVLNYSIPVNRKIRLDELQPHLFSIPEKPDWIPYKTSYYNPNWGFCISEHQRRTLGDDEYEVNIDTSLEKGHLTFAECVLPGQLDDEILFSSHICHPSLCNDNLSGITVAVTLAKLLNRVPRKYSYRFLFIPGTIGAITWLSINEDRVSCVKYGLVLSCLGDRGGLTYKRSRRGDTDIDRAAVHVLQSSQAPHEVCQFSPYGYDERQYCSPGFNLAVGVLSRTPHGRFAEYHTSADNLDFVTPEALADSLDTCLSIVQVLEENERYRNLNPKCEPQLGRRGLYSALGGHGDVRRLEEALLWVLNFSDGTRTLLDIAETSRLPFRTIRNAAVMLHRQGLLAMDASEH